MKIKLDENLPAILVRDLASLGHECDTVAEEGLKGRSDPEVWQATQRAQRFLTTQDLDFSDIRQFKPGQSALSLRQIVRFEYGVLPKRSVAVRMLSI